jgi:large subunit ribosomal protein L5
MNKMREIRIEKVTLNIGTGTAGENVEKAIKLLETITGRKPIETKAKKRIPSWGVRPGLTVGVKVTLRKKHAEELLERLLLAVDKKLPISSFDNNGNISFGIQEYIDIPGIDYMVEIGIMGLEVSITLERGGFRIKRRKFQRGKISSRHKISKDEAIEFMKSKFNIKLKEEEDDNE